MAAYVQSTHDHPALQTSVCIRGLQATEKFTQLVV